MPERVAKKYWDGTHRVVSPRETLARIQPFFSKMGITRLANVTGLDTIGIPVVMCCRPNSRALAVSQGKGWDLDAAKASAAMEAIEAWHAEHVTLPLKLATYEELRAAHRVVDISLLPRTAASRVHPNLPLLWVEGDDWLQGEKVWVPFQLVHGAYTTAMRFDLSGFDASSTGLAGGNHPLEAASHAVCEVVERDALYKFSLLSESERNARRIDLDTVSHPQCREHLDRCSRAGVAVAAWDVTSDVGLAAVYCLIAERDDEPFRRLYAAAGVGCHPASHIAFQRALTEAAQSRLTVISGARDDNLRRAYLGWRDPSSLERLRRLASMAGSRPFSAIPSFEAAAFEEDLERELELVRRAGFDRVVALDLTMPEFAIPVLRVIIPGMRRLGDQDPLEGCS
ncbi:MAG TPA: YcaO-like family protein [Bryobacteraceae bacterium]|nr:YcaO-like family protein [Bryobacteraceae bacterium]